MTVDAFDDDPDAIVAHHIREAADLRAQRDELVLVVRALALVEPEAIWAARGGDVMTDAFAEAGADVLATCVLCGAHAHRERRRVEPKDLFWNGTHATSCPYQQARLWDQRHPAEVAGLGKIGFTGDGTTAVGR